MTSAVMNATSIIALLRSLTERHAVSDRAYLSVLLKPLLLKTSPDPSARISAWGVPICMYFSKDSTGDKSMGTYTLTLPPKSLLIHENLYGGWAMKKPLDRRPNPVITSFINTGLPVPVIGIIAEYLLTYSCDMPGNINGVTISSVSGDNVLDSLAYLTRRGILPVKTDEHFFLILILGPSVLPKIIQYMDIVPTIGFSVRDIVHQKAGFGELS